MSTIRRLRGRLRRSSNAWLMLAVAALATISGVVTDWPAAAAAGPSSAGGEATLEVGTRLTWQAGDSVLSGLLMVPDPDGPFERDGQRYRPQESGGSGGVGLEQVTIVANGPAGVVGDVRTFVNVDLATNAHVAGSSGAVSGTADRLEPYWVAPSTLSQLAEGRNGGTTIVRGRQLVGGQPRDVVSISSQSANSYASSTYDLATGILIFSGTMVAAEGTTITDGGSIALQASGTVSYSHKAFAGSRVLNVPWAQAPLPSWFSGTTTYAGATSMESDPSTGLGGLPGQQLAVGYSFDRPVDAATVLGRQSVQSSTTAGVAPLEQATPRVFTSMAFDGLWVPPDALARLQASQVLDRDDLNGQTVTFEGTQSGAALIAVTSPLERLELYYDVSTGRLLMARNRQQAGGVGAQIVELSWTGQ